MEFYAAASQIIPVLLLALIFENRALSKRPSSYDASQRKDPSNWNATQVVARIWATVTIAAAETAALVGLYRQHEDRLTNGVVWLGLMVSLAMVLYSVVNRQGAYLREWWSSGAASDLWLVVFVGLALVVVSWQFLARF